MFTYVMKSKTEELIEGKLNQEFPGEVELRENQHFDSDDEMTSEPEETDDMNQNLIMQMLTIWILQIWQ